MSRESEELRRALKENSFRGENIYSLMGTVTNVYGNKEFCSVTPLNEGSVLPNVRLTPDGEDEDLLVIPSIGSTVVVSFLDNITAYVSMFSKVDTICLKGDAHGGLVKIEELVSKLNNIESEINKIQESLTVPVSPNTPVDASAVTRRLIETEKEELENPNVTHG